MFHFRLQTLLRLRVAERDERRADLAKAFRAEAVLREQEQGLESDRAELAKQGRRLKSPGAADVDALLRTHRYEVVLAAQSRQVASQLTQVRAEIERRRQALVEADRQVRVLEKLRQRQAEAHRQQEQRLENKRFDEQAQLGFIRQREVAS
jgi:flagellar protein FliJ